MGTKPPVQNIRQEDKKIKMTQKKLEKIDWDDENPLNENVNNVEKWVKLQKGDTLLGIYIDNYKDPKFKQMKYFFSNATIIKTEDNTKKHYKKIGINSSGNLDFILKNNDQLLGTPLKIIRMDDIPLEGKPKPAHHFKIIKPKNTEEGVN